MADDEPREIKNVAGQTIHNPDLLIVLAIVAVPVAYYSLKWFRRWWLDDEPEPDEQNNDDMWVVVNGEQEMSLAEYRQEKIYKDWKKWLEEFWPVWENLGFPGHDKFCKQTGLSLDFYKDWKSTMDFYQHLGLIIVKPRKPVEVLTRGKAALAVIRNRALAPIPDEPAPEANLSAATLPQNTDEPGQSAE